MNISFFQTYGERLPLLKVRTEDVHFQKFLNNFDMNIVSLHDVSDSVKEFVNNNAIVPNQVIFEFKNKSYGECISALINFLKDKKPEKFFFYQDDTFSCEITNQNEYDLCELVFESGHSLINLSYKLEHLREHHKWNEIKKVIYKTSAFNLYDTTTDDFKKSGLWPFDDSCFVCTLDKLLEIYDPQYFQYSDVWTAELYLNHKFENLNMLRPITDTSFFINYNILGRNTNPQNLLNLKNKIKLSPDTLKMLEGI